MQATVLLAKTKQRSTGTHEKTLPPSVKYNIDTDVLKCKTQIYMSFSGCCCFV